VDHLATTGAVRPAQGIASVVCPAVPICREVPGVHFHVAVVAVDVNGVMHMLTTFINNTMLVIIK
jgi:hypothetical protein